MTARRRRFALLDRDGTIMADRGYLGDPEGVELLPRAVDGLRRMRGSGLGLAVLTNQSGIGRGLFDVKAVERVHNRLRELLRREGVELDGIYFCPHAPEAGCRCRKPETGLAEQAARELDFDPACAFVIGDKESDVELGRRLGGGTVLIAAGPLAGRPELKADFAARDLAEAGEWIASRLASFSILER